jgi:hypothetical protein
MRRFIGSSFVVPSDALKESMPAFYQLTKEKTKGLRGHQIPGRDGERGPDALHHGVCCTGFGYPAVRLLDQGAVQIPEVRQVAFENLLCQLPVAGESDVGAAVAGGQNKGPCGFLPLDFDGRPLGVVESQLFEELVADSQGTGDGEFLKIWAVMVIQILFGETRQAVDEDVADELLGQIPGICRPRRWWREGR